MEALYLLIPLSVLAVFLIVAVLWWASSGGQFDDLDGPGHRILLDNDEAATIERLQSTGKPERTGTRRDI